MSRPSKVHPSHAAMPERHCCFEICRKCVTPPAAGAAVVVGADGSALVASMLIEDQVAGMALKREPKKACDSKAAEDCRAPRGFRGVGAQQTLRGGKGASERAAAETAALQW